MRLIATHEVGGMTKRVIIISILFDEGNLKAVYLNEDGEIDEAPAEDFTAEYHELVVLVGS